MKKSRSSKMNKPALNPAIQRVCGRSEVAVLGSSTTSSIIPIQPSSFARCLAMGDVFEFYRFTSLKVEIPPLVASLAVANEVAVGYSNQTFDTPPTSVAAVMELPCATRNIRRSTVFRSFTVSRNELIANAPLKWYKTIVGTPEALFETQGNLYVAADGNDAPTVLVIEWEVEFSQWNLAGQSPLSAHPALEPIPGTDLFRRKNSTKPTFESNKPRSSVLTTE